MLNNMRKVIRQRLLAGAGNTHPILMAALMRGYYEPNNPASCYKCGMMGVCPHDLTTEVKGVTRHFKHSKAIADNGHKFDGLTLNYSDDITQLPRMVTGAECQDGERDKRVVGDGTN